MDQLGLSFVQTQLRAAEKITKICQVLIQGALGQFRPIVCDIRRSVISELKVLADVMCRDVVQELIETDWPQYGSLWDASHHLAGCRGVTTELDREGPIRQHALNSLDQVAIYT